MTATFTAIFTTRSLLPAGPGPSARPGGRARYPPGPHLIRQRFVISAGGPSGCFRAVARLAWRWRAAYRLRHRVGRRGSGAPIPPAQRLLLGGGGAPLRAPSNVRRYMYAGGGMGGGGGGGGGVWCGVFGAGEGSEGNGGGVGGGI
eukprot:25141-Prorocentrum_minimum.AAC.1